MVNLRKLLRYFKNLMWRAPGRLTCGNLKEVLSKCIGNWSGTLLVNLRMESLRKSFKNQLEVGVESP